MASFVRVTTTNGVDKLVNPDFIRAMQKATKADVVILEMAAGDSIYVTDELDGLAARLSGASGGKFYA